MVKGLAVMLAVVMAFGTVACGNTKGDVATDGSNAQVENEQSGADVQDDASGDSQADDSAANDQAQTESKEPSQAKFWGLLWQLWCSPARPPSAKNGEVPLAHCISMSCPCCCSVATSCLIICIPMDCSTPGFPVLHYLLERAQTYVH